MSYTTEVMAIFVRFLRILAKFGCHGNVPEILAVRNVFFGLADHKKTPCYK